MKRLSFAFFCVLSISACESLNISWLWKEYHHPTYGFSFRYPRSWKISEGGTFGTLLTILPPDENTLFKANANLLIEPTPENLPLKTLSERSKLQLESILRNYQTLALQPTNFGTLDAIEIRGKYEATEGWRLIRTWLAMTKKNTYVFTFTCLLEEEAPYVRRLRKIIDSFAFSKN